MSILNSYTNAPSSPSSMTQCAQNSAENMFPLRHAATLACVALTKEMDDYDEQFFRSSSIDQDLNGSSLNLLCCSNRNRHQPSILDSISGDTNYEYQMFNSMDFEDSYRLTNLPQNIWNQIEQNDDSKSTSPGLIDALMAKLSIKDSQKECIGTNKATPSAYPPEEVDTAMIPLDENGMLTSMGSINHAFGICRPCAFINNPRKEGCINGIQCAFCHFKHPTKRRLPRPSKHQRMMRRFDKSDLSQFARENSATNNQNCILTSKSPTQDCMSTCVCARMR